MADWWLGYAAARTRYHSWLGAVHPAWRRRGIARGLMDLQHAWLGARGYTSVETSALADNAPMLSLNLSTGFRVIGSYDRGSGSRLTLAKALTG